MKLRVLFVATECTPLTKAGGLADVVSSLPRALSELGIEVGVALPAYKGLHGSESCSQADIPIFLVENDSYFGESEEPYMGEDIDPKRFAYFSRQVIQCLGKWKFRPNVIHAHDWHTSLVPSAARELGLSAATVLTIHNISAQGISLGDSFFPSGLSERDLKSLEWDFQDRKLDLLLQGVLNADMVSTVSPTYAREVLEPEFGEGLQDVLRVRKDHLLGILNGLDYKVYNPACDGSIFQPYNLSNFEAGKAANKEALQKELGLGVSGEPMLVGFISHLSDRKGLSLLDEALLRMLDLPIQLVTLGEGNKRYERELEALSRNYPSKFSVQIGSDSTMKRKICAAADLILIPSRFEPCGSIQMIAMRYGALPLVRATGGLRDSVIDGEDGFVFEKYEVAQMLTTLRRALRVFGTPAWGRMVARALQKDFSWEKSAEKYVELYEKALEYAKTG